MMAVMCEAAAAECVKIVTCQHSQRSHDLVTITNFLVTCLQPEVLHISRHMNGYICCLNNSAQLQIRLQITGKLLIPVDWLN